MSVTPLIGQVRVAPRCYVIGRGFRHADCKVYPVGFSYHRGGFGLFALAMLVGLVLGWPLGYWLSNKLPEGGRPRPSVPMRTKVRERVAAREREQGADESSGAEQ